MEYSKKIIQKRNTKEDVYTDKQGKEILENNFESRKKGYTTTIFGIKEEGLRIKHRNGKITKLMLAKAISVRNGDALVIDAADDIAFELKEGQQIGRNALQEIAYEYERQSELKDEICNYLGIVDYTEKGYKMDQKSLKVEEYVKQNVVSQILEERNERKRVWEERYRQRQKIEEEQRRKFTESLDAKDYETAVGVLEELGDYKDSQSLLKDARYHYAIELINSCNYSTAITELEALGDYQNSVELRKKAEIGEDAYIEIDTVAIELAYWEEDLNTDGTFYNCGVLDVSGVFFLKENRVELFFLMDSESKEFANRNLKIILEDWKTEDLLYMLAEMGLDITLSVGEVYSSDEVSPDAFTQLVEDYASAGTGYFIDYYDDYY